MAVTGTITTNFKDENGVDLGRQLVEKDYLISVYPNLIPSMKAPSAMAWGANTTNGQLGDNTTVQKSSPVQVLTPANITWKQISGGFSFAAGIGSDGTLWAWGNNSYSQLGNGTTGHRSSPIQTVAFGTNWSTISTGGRHMASVKADGTLWCWGFGTSGQLGDNTIVTKSSPVQTLFYAENWTSAANGYVTAAAVKTDGTIWTWGQNTSGGLGDNTTIHRSSPVQVVGFATNWSTVSCGYRFAAAIKKDGTLWAWGLGTSGQLGNNSASSTSSPVQTVTFGTNWSSVACGQYHTMAIKTDGTLWGFGGNSYGQLGNNSITSRSSPVQTVTFETNWSKVACGYEFSSGIKTDGTLWTWGRNQRGQLGDNSITDRSSPVQTIAFGTNWSSVGCGHFHMAAVKTDGTLWCWGTNDWGQLGDFSGTSRSSPVQTAAFGTNWSDVDGGNRFTNATKTDGTLWSWGDNSLGQLGSTSSVLSPIQTTALGTNWSKAYAGGGNAFAVKKDGTLWSWGSGSNGMLGNNTNGSNRSVPATVLSYTFSTNWSKISAGYTHTAGIRKDGTLWTWGDNAQGKLGNNSSANTSFPIQEITVSTTWSNLSAGSSHTAATKSDNSLWLWGYNASGQLGDGTVTSKSSPVQALIPTTTWTSNIAAGGLHAAGVKSDGTLWLWGYNVFGQLGDNTTTHRSSPIQTLGFATNWSKVSCANHTAAIKTDGTLWLWGLNGLGQLGDGTTIRKSSPVQTVAGGSTWNAVSCGYSFTAATKTDGTLWVWGNNINGQLGDNTSTNRSSPVQTVTFGTNWSSIAAAKGNLSDFCAATKTDGTLWIWGLNNSGQLGDGTLVNKSSPVQVLVPAKNWTAAISGGTTISAAIKSDGTLWSWGIGTTGQLGDNTIVSKSSPVQTTTIGTNWNMVACGTIHAAAIKTDGTLWTWGRNSYGALGDNSITHRSSPVQVLGFATTWSAVACGNLHTVALKTDGTLWSWGRNDEGQLGDNTLTHRSSPVQTVAFGSNWNTVSAGDTFTGATKTDGTLWCWGRGTEGQIGNNSNLKRSSPIQTVAGATNWTSVSCGFTHNAGIKNDGTLWLWGTNTSGQLGDGTTTTSSSPVQTITFGTNWTQVSCGTSFTSARKADGTIWTFGLGTSGQLGDGTLVSKSSPVQIIGNTWNNIDAGDSHVVASKTDGTVYNWGLGTSGQLGDGFATTATNPVIPRAYSGFGTDWSLVALGYRYGVAKKTDNTLWTWGIGTSGQLGDNTNITKSLIVQECSISANWNTIQTGYAHTIATKTDGSLWSWGVNVNGNLGDSTAIAKNSPVQTVFRGNTWNNGVGGNAFSVGTKSTGTIFSWGLGTDGRLGDNAVTTKSIPTIPFSFGVGTTWSSIACGLNHTSAIKTDGTLWCWGSGTSAQLGNNTAVNQSIPTQEITYSTNWSKVSAGYQHTGGIKTDGTAWCWGTGTNGQIGDGNATTRSTPTQVVVYAENWSKNAMGASNAASIKTDGTLWVWGRNSYGQIGDNTIVHRSSPVQTIAFGTNWSSVACGGQSTNGHIASIKTDGTLWLWGSNVNGRLGDNSTTHRSSPVQVVGFTTTWSKVACGADHSAAIKTDGTLWCWGKNESGQLGDNTIVHRSSPVQTTAFGTNWSSVSCGNSITAAIKTDGTLWGWGYNLEGRLADNTNTNRSSPVQTVTFATNWSSVVAGRDCMLAIKTDGTLWSWGSNAYGQLGDNTLTNRSSPVQTISRGTNWASIALTTQQSTAIAVKTDNTLWCWGNNANGQVGNNSTTNRSSPVQTALFGSTWNTVAGGYACACSIKKDGTFWTWGLNTNGVLGNNNTTAVSVPTQPLAYQFATTWSNISCGTNNTLATRTNNTLWAWGANTNGVLGLNNTTNISIPTQVLGSTQNWNLTSFADSSFLSTGSTAAAIKTDGTLWTWGNNGNGQLGEFLYPLNRSSPTQTLDNTSQWQQVAGGFSHTMALKNDGTLWGFGQNDSGELGINNNRMTLSPTQEITGSTWKQVSAGRNFTAAIKSDSSLWTWGRNDNGQLGDNTIVNKSSPVQEITKSTNWSYIACGHPYMAGIKSDGTLWLWGGGYWGNIGTGIGATSAANYSSPVQTIRGGNNWKQIAVNGDNNGAGSSLAVKTDGTLWYWGNNANFQVLSSGGNIINSPIQLIGSNWKKVAAGAFHYAGIKTDGSLWTFGINTNGQLGNNTTTLYTSPIQTLISDENWKDVTIGNWGNNVWAIRDWSY